MARLPESGLLTTQRLKLTIAYDGRPFSGWQSQIDGNGIQDHLEAALSKIAGQPVRVHGSGRTDAGVHALGQVAHADVPARKHPLPTWLNATNANLPPEVRVLRITSVPGGRDGFHARYRAVGKRYDYRIWNAPWQHPLEIGRTWHVPKPLDILAMRAAAALLLGQHDFAGFAANRGEPETDTVRTLTRVSIVKKGQLVTLRFEGNGFLYKMVRLLTGTLVRIGERKADPLLILSLLQAKGGQKTQFAAPAAGLFLVQVRYTST